MSEPGWAFRACARRWPWYETHRGHRIGRATEHDRAACITCDVWLEDACRCVGETCAEFAPSPEKPSMARVEELFEIPVVEPEAMPDEDIILVILRRLVAGRALLGHELAAERGLLSEESLAAKVVAFHAGTPENVDPERVAWLLAGCWARCPSRTWWSCAPARPSGMPSRRAASSTQSAAERSSSASPRKG